MIGKPLCIEALELLGQLENESVNLVFCDPPYNIGIFAKMPPDEYLEWCRQWIAEASRVLVANGAFWVVHKDPKVLVDLSRMIANYGKARTNWITWDKYNGNPTIQACGGPMVGMTQVASLRSFQVMAEYLIYHADEGEWTAQYNKEREFIFEPLRAYLDGERRRAGITCKTIAKILGTSTTMVSQHYMSRSQWALPTKEVYTKMQALFNAKNGTKSEYLCRKYEYLYHEYEDIQWENKNLRYTFNSPGKVSSVWQIPPALKNGHPTPKPQALLERIIETTSNKGDVVLDFFAGSFTTALVAESLGRQWICGDYDPKWVKLGARLLQEQRQQPELL